MVMNDGNPIYLYIDYQHYKYQSQKMHVCHDTYNMQ